MCCLNSLERSVRIIADQSTLLVPYEEIMGAMDSPLATATQSSLGPCPHPFHCIRPGDINHQSLVHQCGFAATALRSGVDMRLINMDVAN